MTQDRRGYRESGEETNAAEQQRGIAGTEITKELLLTLLPTSMGLMLARTGMIVGAQRQLYGNRRGHLYRRGVVHLTRSSTLAHGRAWPYR